jgi:hypothetical protein
VEIEEGIEGSPADGFQAVVLTRLAIYFSILNISFPCCRQHLEVATLVKVAMDDRWSAGMVFEAREDGLECELVLRKVLRYVAVDESDISGLLQSRHQHCAAISREMAEREAAFKCVRRFATRRFSVGRSIVDYAVWHWRRDFIPEWDWYVSLPKSMMAGDTPMLLGLDT